MKKSIQMLGALAGLALLSDGGMGMPLMSAPRRNVVRNGHTAWNTNKDTKVRRWRAKERRAKSARKINWA